MTLQEWINDVDICPTLSYISDVPIPDTWDIRDKRHLLWNLSDYFVSSVSGGTIWLLPRK